MPTAFDTLSDSFNRQFHRFQPDVYQIESISFLFAALNKRRYAPRRQGRLKGEIDSHLCKRIDAFEHYPPRVNGYRLRSKGRQPGGKRIGVDIFQTAQRLRHNAQRAGRLSGAVWTGEEVGGGISVWL